METQKYICPTSLVQVYSCFLILHLLLLVEYVLKLVEHQKFVLQYSLCYHLVDLKSWPWFLSFAQWI